MERERVGEMDTQHCLLCVCEGEKERALFTGAGVYESIRKQVHECGFMGMLIRMGLYGVGCVYVGGGGGVVKHGQIRWPLIRETFSHPSLALLGQVPVVSLLLLFITGLTPCCKISSARPSTWVTHRH